MSKRSRFGGVFKLKGIWWTVRHYQRDGKRRICYSPKMCYEPIFSDKPLTKLEILEITNKVDKKWADRGEN